MSDSKQKTSGLLWILIIIIIILLIILGVIFPNWAIWLWIPISLVIVVGFGFTFTQFFFEKKKHCPKCNTQVPSLYSKTCVKCGLSLITRCPDCGKYLNTYVDGKPVKFCNDCGLQLKEDIKVEILQNPYQQTNIVKFCPTCGVNIEERNIKFCSLCGAKID